MKITSISLLLLLFFCPLHAQKHKSTIIKAAKTFASAQLKNNVDKLVELTHPNIVSMAGGVAAYKSLIQESESLEKSQGFKTERITTVDASEVLRAGAEIHSVVTRTVIIKIGEAKFETESYLLAASSDNGKKWSFVDLAAYNYDNILKFFPDFNPNTIIPRAKAPRQIN